VSDVVAERHGAVLVCRLNRPTAHNGLTGALIGEYLGLLADARADDAVRVVVTTGEGDAFSAGADMSDLSGETARQGLNALLHERLGLTGTLSVADRSFDRLGIGRETLAIKNYDKPLIAAVNGAAPVAVSHWRWSMTSEWRPNVPRSQARSFASDLSPRWACRIRCRGRSDSRPRWTSCTRVVR
jgi:1,4-dihydroxy-2-naphthoyl-CoA synthase